VQSPINGRVSKAEITLGNLVDASAVLTSVVSLDRIYASFDGDEETYLRVGAAAHQGKPATVRIGLANEEGFRMKASWNSSTTSSMCAAVRCACAPP
jgi:multidrug efflux system membrane fusion protein